MIPLVLVFSLCFPGSSQELKSGAVFLKSGPVLKNTIEILPPNTYQAYSAEYQTGSGPVNVIFSMAHPRYFGAAEYCGGLILTRIAGTDQNVYAVRIDTNILFFFVFPGNYETHCRFISVFTERFLFFWNTSIHKTDIPFPAVLEL
ncbi:MAG: hypothetical protein JW904_03160 [Spirochaetales bacterium]|nr:hypothetical protein [Spirochaetales bacterium]